MCEKLIITSLFTKIISLFCILNYELFIPKIGAIELNNLTYINFYFYSCMFLNVLHVAIDNVNNFSSTIATCIHLVR